jgi:hypothetical protein
MCAAIDRLHVELAEGEDWLGRQIPLDVELLLAKIDERLVAVRHGDQCSLAAGLHPSLLLPRERVDDDDIAELADRVGNRKPLKDGGVLVSRADDQSVDVVR